MVIEYQITRFDPVKSYFFNLRHSKKTQIFVFGAAAIIIFLTLSFRYNAHNSLVPIDFMAAFLSGLGFILVIPALNFLTAKTQTRTFSISPQGIETKIGRHSGKISWYAVDSIAVTKDRIFITGMSANTFTIPSSAFASDEERNQFIELATQYHQDAKRPAGRVK
jgi:hypothetical protein